MGPGTYNTPDLLGGPDSQSFTIGLKRDGGPVSSNPGPGQYNLLDNLTYPTAPAYTISPNGGRGGIPGQDQLGPGEYNPIDNTYP